MYDRIENHKDVIVGSVSNSGLILNDISEQNPGFGVYTYGNTQFEVTLLGEGSGGNKSRPNLPIVIATPIWFTDYKTKYPSDISFIGIAVVRPDYHNQFTVQVGTYRTDSGKTYGHTNVGMNFMALDPNLDNRNIITGFVDIVNGTPISQPNKKYNVTSSGRQDEAEIDQGKWLCDQFRASKICPEVNFTASDFGGVYVVFEDNFQFKGLPSVIVTPVIDHYTTNCAPDNWRGFRFDRNEIALPHCVVDMIERSRFAVKCGCVYSTTISDDAPKMEYKFLPFNFVAVGPA